jgi:hypothetical protein
MWSTWHSQKCFCKAFSGRHSTTKNRSKDPKDWLFGLFYEFEKSLAVRMKCIVKNSFWKFDDCFHRIDIPFVITSKSY